MRLSSLMRRRTPALLVLLAVSLSGLVWAATRVTPEPALFDAAQVCRRLALNGPGGRALAGQAEDLAVDAARGELIVSLYDRKAGRRAGAARAGGLFTAPLSALSAAQGSLTLAVLSDDPALTRPHGLALGPDRLAVVARDGAGGARIRVLARTETGWRPAGALNHPRVCRANDLAWLDEDRLLISVDRRSCGGVAAAMEQMTGAPGGSLLHWDLQAGAVRVVGDGLAFANGVTSAQGAVSVAETRGPAVRVYDGAALAATPLPLQTFKTRALPGGPDNLSTTADGRVLAALHPNLLRLALSRYGPFSNAPGRVALIEGDWVRTLLDDPRGEVIPGATVAVEIAPGLLAVGSVTAPGLGLCDLRAG